MLQLASVRFLINHGKSWGELLWWGAVFHQQLEELSNSNFAQASRTRLFDVCNAVCDTPLEAEESALVRALAYFEGVRGWRISDINHISYLQARAAQ
jgi:hypothetical protein